MKSIKLLFALFLAVVLAASCGGGAAKSEADQLAGLKAEKAAIDIKIAELEKKIGAAGASVRKIRSVELAAVEPTTFRHFIDLQGKIDASKSSQITSKMPGSLKRVLIDVGSNVSAGQLVAELDGEPMFKQLEELKGQLAFATDVFNRQKGLWDQKIGSEIQFLQAKNGKESLERTISTVEENLKNLKIYSPLSGQVDMLFLKAGSAIAPGMPLANVLNLTALKIKGEVPEAYAAKVKQGDAVQVFFPDLQKEISSRVTYVAKSINPLNRTFTVECALPQSAEHRANMIAVLKVIDYQKAGAMTVPVNLIQTAEDGDFVLVAEKSGEKTGTAKKVSVKRGRDYGGQVEILDGLKKGDLIITTGFQDVNAGENINF